MLGGVGLRRALTVGLLLAAACSSKKDRPGSISACTECGGSGGSGATGAGGAAGTPSCEPDPAQGVRVQGDLSVFHDDTFDFNALDAFAGTAEVALTGEPCGYAKGWFPPSAAPASDGGAGAAGADAGGLAGAAGAPQSDVFDVKGAYMTGTKTPNWLRMTPIDNADNVLPTAAAIYTSKNFTGVDIVRAYFALVRTSVVDSIATKVAKTRDPAKAQIFVQVFGGGQGAGPQAGAVFSAQGTEAVVYADAGDWVTGGSGTGGAGWVLLLNVDAPPPLDGAGTKVTVTVGNQSTDFVIVAIAGYVTWFRAQLPFTASP